MNTRRDWLRLFGAGSLIVPLIGGGPDEHNAAQLIETPRIKRVELFKHNSSTLLYWEQLNLEANLIGAEIVLSMRDGSRKRFAVEDMRATGIIDAFSPQIEIAFVNRKTSPLSESALITGNLGEGFMSEVRGISEVLGIGIPVKR